VRPTGATFRIARLWLAAFHVVLVAASRGGAPSSLATLTFSVRRHEGYPQALVLGLEARPLRRLLVAYNASERARRALTWAVRLQRSLPAEIVVLTVRQSERDAVEQWAQDARERLAGSALSRCHFVVRDGEPVAEIVAAAAERQADCTLMGGYRHTAAIEWLVSSTTKGVLKRLALPVLVA
jgi:nucleotide-binding universal stress UspA family protein